MPHRSIETTMKRYVDFVGRRGRRRTVQVQPPEMRPRAQRCAGWATLWITVVPLRGSQTKRTSVYKLESSFQESEHSGRQGDSNPKRVSRHLSSNYHRASSAAIRRCPCAFTPLKLCVGHDPATVRQVSQFCAGLATHWQYRIPRSSGDVATQIRLLRRAAAKPKSRRATPAEIDWRRASPGLWLRLGFRAGLSAGLLRTN